MKYIVLAELYAYFWGVGMGKAENTIFYKQMKKKI